MTTDKLDQATKERLGKLASMPVDMSSIERRIAQEFPSGETSKTPTHRKTTGWLRLAAMVALFAGVTAAVYIGFFGVDPSAAVAQTLTVSELHRQLMADPQATHRTDNLDDAQQLIDAQLSGELSLPIVEGTSVESCCLISGSFPLRAVLVIEHELGPVTVVIAQGEGFAHPMQPIEHPSGKTLYGHDVDGLPMVMQHVGDLWMCVMGEPGAAHLEDTAAGLVLPEVR